MPSFLHHVVCSLTILRVVGLGAALPYNAEPNYFQSLPVSRRSLAPAQVQRELGSILSNTSTIFGPSDPKWDEATTRWNTATEPDVQLVVQPGREPDVAEIVKYCNRNSIKFLATNGGHASDMTIATFKGLQIDLSTLNAMGINSDGESAWVQGGTYIGQVVSALWEQGYVTASGSTACPGFLGPALGGGHGRYEGLYGLASDNFINLNVVLANGSEITVNATSHADLFWAMKGAGHNFGIVTSAESKIYPRQIDTWHYHNYVWTQDKLETLFEKLSQFHKDGKTPAKMGVNFGSFNIDTSISEIEPVLKWYFAYAGSEEDAEELLQPFNDIGAVREESGDVPYPEIFDIQGMAVDGPTCLARHRYVGTSAKLQTYDIPTQRKIYQLFNETISQYPLIGAGGTVLYEGYATEATQKVDPTLSAYPHRDDIFIVFFSAALLEDGLEEPAQELSDQIQELWYTSQNGRERDVYVNYAVGSETRESLYGHEPWRLERLRELKSVYDPENVFRYMAPIITATEESY